MNRKVQIEWKYTPEDFLETTYELDFNNSKIQFSQGEIILESNENSLQEDPFFVANAEKTIINFLNGFSIQHHSLFKLSRKDTKYFNKDGSISKKEGKTIKTISTTLTVGVNTHVEFQLKDKDGNIIRDSRQERIQEEKEFATLLASTDSENQRLIDSYINAIKNKKNEFTYLYEIRDFISTKLGGKPNVKNKLQISESEWNSFGEIVNVRPLLEGRHRGEYEEELRNATSEELKKVRNIARKLLFEYLKYYESNL